MAESQFLLIITVKHILISPLSLLVGKFCDVSSTQDRQTDTLQSTGETVHLGLDLPQRTPR